jgi:ABC-type oligopeptide transport system substrate-binding subunit
VVVKTLRDLEYDVVLKTHGPLAVVPDCWFGALSRDADVSYVAWAFDFPSPGAFMVPLLSCVGPDGTPLRVSGVPSDTFNASNFCDREIDRRMQRAIDLQLTDPHASARAFEALDHDLVDLAPMIPFQTPTDVWLVSKRASNVEFNTVYIGPIVSQVWLR